MVNFPSRHTPYEHQSQELHNNYQEPFWGVFWEQGTGKTKLQIDNAVQLYLEGKITALVILAPEGVHTNWALDEIPEHISPDVEYRVGEWVSSKASTKYHQKRFEQLRKFDGLQIVCMTYSGYMTKAGKTWITKFFDKHKVFFVLDESTKIKTPGIRLTKSLLAFGKRAPFKRVLTGTPVTNSPFDLYSQIKFLDPDFWKKHGLNSYFAFKNYFGEFQRIELGPRQSFEKLVRYCNLQELSIMIEPVTSRVTKDDVLDLPPKQYSRQYFDMSPTMTKAFTELKKEFVTVIENMKSKEDELVYAELAITRLLRCQQVSCGFMQVDGGEVHQLEEKNQRLKVLQDIIDTHPGKMIIWARFTPDIDLIMKHLGDRAVRYDGQTPQSERHENKTRFQDGDADFFVVNQAAGAAGLTLHSAETVVYYSNSFSNYQRIQSEDRAHRAGLKHTVKYIDIIARDSYDLHILDSLRNNKDVADAIIDGGFRE